MSNHRKTGPTEINLGRVIRSPKGRLYLYGIVGAVLGVLLMYGYINEDELPRWLDLAAAILTPSTLAVAAANVPTRSDG